MLFLITDTADRQSSTGLAMGGIGLPASHSHRRTSPFYHRASHPRFHLKLVHPPSRLHLWVSPPFLLLFFFFHPLSLTPRWFLSLALKFPRFFSSDTHYHPCPSSLLLRLNLASKARASPLSFQKPASIKEEAPAGSTSPKRYACRYKSGPLDRCSRLVLGAH